MQNYMRTILSGLQNWINTSVREAVPKTSKAHQEFITDSNGEVKWTDRNCYEYLGTDTIIKDNSPALMSTEGVISIFMSSTPIFNYPIEGETYTVIHNKNTYTSNCSVIWDDGYRLGWALGNIDLIEGTGDTGDKYIAMIINPELSESENITAMFYDLSSLETGAPAPTEMTIKISGPCNIIKKLDSKFIPDLPYTPDNYNSNILNGRYDDSLRTGSAREENDEYWLGSGAFAQGSDTVASGNHSHAEGEITTASGGSAHSEGFRTEATGGSSHAEGSLTRSSGTFSHSEGERTEAVGNHSHAEGSEVCAYGNHSHAEGGSYLGSIIISGEANATEYTCKLYPTYLSKGSRLYIDNNDQNRVVVKSVNIDSEGVATIKVNKTLSETALSEVEVKHLFGHASGQKSHSEGYGTIASGTYSHAEGVQTNSKGYCSHAEGQLTESVGSYSHAEGMGSDAYGNYSHAEGSHTRTRSEGAHAEGRTTSAYGKYSHAEGIGYGADEARKIKVSGEANSMTYVVDEGQFNSDNLYGDTGRIGLGSLIGLYSTGSYTYKVLQVDLDTNTITLDGTLSSSKTLDHEEVYLFTDGSFGPYSHSEGNGTTAHGVASHSEGKYAKALGDHSHAEGEYTAAFSKGQHVQGRYNLPDQEGKYAHIVGNGYLINEYSNLATHSNAHTIDWEGNGWFSGEVKVGGSSQDDPESKTLATQAYVDGPKNYIALTDTVTGQLYHITIENGNLVSTLVEGGE